MVAQDDAELSMLRLFRECTPDQKLALLSTALRFAGPAAELLDQAHPLAPTTGRPGKKPKR